MVYKAFIYEKVQSYTVCRKCMSNNTRLQKKNTLRIATFKQTNEMETKQHKYYTNDMKVAHKHILIHRK